MRLKTFSTNKHPDYQTFSMHAHLTVTAM